MKRKDGQKLRGCRVERELEDFYGKSKSRPHSAAGNRLPDGRFGQVRSPQFVHDEPLLIGWERLQKFTHAVDQALLLLGGKFVHRDV